MQDAELTELLRKKFEKALKALMKSYGGIVCAVIRRVLPQGSFGAEAVETCAADTFREFYLDFGKGASEMTVNMNPQTSTTQDATQDTAETDITGYQPSMTLTVMRNSIPGAEILPTRPDPRTPR